MWCGEAVRGAGGAEKNKENTEEGSTGLICLILGFSRARGMLGGCQAGDGRWQRWAQRIAITAAPVG